MQPGDLPGIHALQCRAYPADYHEPLAALATRLHHGASFCFVAEGADGGLSGYVFAHPWAGPPPALHLPLPASPAPDHVFLHDLAIDPDRRQQGTARSLLAAVREAAATQQQEIRLVALEAAQAFWLAHAFTPAADLLDPGYGAATLMVAGHASQQARRFKFEVQHSE